jgi:hypothetical protein
MDESRRQSQATPSRAWVARRSALSFILFVLVAGNATAQVDALIQQFGGRNAAEARRAAQELQRGMRQVQRQSEQEAHEQTCERMVQWVSTIDGIPPDALQRRQAGVAVTRGGASTAAQVPLESWFLDDAHFVPAFGKPFDAIGAQEAVELQRSASRCRSALSSQGRTSGIDAGFPSRVFHPAMRERYAEGLRTIRAARAEVANAMQELPTLAADEAGSSRLRELAADSERLAGFLEPQARSAYREALRLADRRIAQPQQLARARDAAMRAQGYDGLVELAGVQAELAKDAIQQGRAGSLQSNPAMAELRARQSEIARSLVAQERSRIDALGTGMVALERGAQWYREYRARYERLATTVPELREIFVMFETRRLAQIDSAREELSARITRTRSTLELEQIKATYLPLEIDTRSASGTALLTAWRSGVTSLTSAAY